MIGAVDSFCLGASNRLAAFLQERCALTMPMILRQAATATILATTFAIIATALMRGPIYLVITLVFGAITIGAFWKLLTRYNRDADKDWTSDLARDYMVRAIGATEGQRRMREIGIILAVISLALTFMVVQMRPFDLVDLTMIALVACTMMHLYLSCAEPRPPGSGRRDMKTAFAGSR